MKLDMRPSVHAVQEYTRTNGTPVSYDHHCFIGSPFSLSVASALNDDHHIQHATVQVGLGASLHLSTATLSNASTATLEFCVKDDGAGHFLPLCTFTSHHKTLTGLGIQVTGPSQLWFSVKSDEPDALIHIFGSVIRDEHGIKEAALLPPSQLMSAEEELPISAGDTSLPLVTTKEKSHGESRKRKTVHIEENPTILSQSQEANNQEVVQAMPQSLTKKQRKLQAKQKAKELADAVAVKEGHDKTPKKAKDVTKPAKKTPVSLTKDRRLRSGVVVKDFILGNGPAVKPGRQVSILYEGSFPNSDKVFDRNQNKNHPLTFRIGTGEVIRGLEHGIEGMKVGGERTITIPPELAYGRKGSGNTIPKNATLVFSVQLLDIGSKA